MLKGVVSDHLGVRKNRDAFIAKYISGLSPLLSGLKHGYKIYGKVIVNTCITW